MMKRIGINEEKRKEYLSKHPKNVFERECPICGGIYEIQKKDLLYKYNYDNYDYGEDNVPREYSYVVCPFCCEKIIVEKY